MIPTFEKKIALFWQLAVAFIHFLFVLLLNISKLSFKAIFEHFLPRTLQYAPKPHMIANS